MTEDEKRVIIQGTSGIFGASLTGKREKDEDYIHCIAIKDIQIAILCDGMGGTKNGELASKEASKAFIKGIQMIHKKYSNRWVSEKYRHSRYKKLIDICHNKVASITGKFGESGTTLTALVTTYDKKIPVSLDLIHIGDSRCYKVKGNNAELLTSDHSVTGDMLRAKYIEIHEIAETPGNNSLTRNIGDENKSSAEIKTLEIDSNYFYLMCCDGVWDPLHKKDGFWTPNVDCNSQNYVDTIVNEAIIRGSTDNCSALVVNL